jgi:predicted metal-dependent peptidase
MVAPIPRLAVVIDTSGSMGTRRSGMALGEVKGILKSMGCGEAMPVLACDAEVHGAQKVFKVDQVKLTGGGGTDMGIGMRAAAELNPRPEIVICLTDMLTPWPEEKPPYRFIVVGLGAEEDAHWAPPAYAKTIYVPDE